MSESLVVTLTEANFTEVIGRSRQVPVLVDFWADWCAPCRQIAPVLEKLAREFKGRLVVAKVNADQEPLITQQFGVRGLPTLKLVVQGQLAGELVGAHPEAHLRQWLQPHLGAPAAPEASPEADFMAQVRAAASAGDLDAAIDALHARLQQAKDDHPARALLAELLLGSDRMDEAGAVLEAGPAGAADLKRPRALLAFGRRTTGLPALAELEVAAVPAAPTEVHFQHALRLVAAGRLEEGIERLLAILRSDRQYGDDAARKALLEVLDILGRDDPLAQQYRRRLASALY